MKARAIASLRPGSARGRCGLYPCRLDLEFDLSEGRFRSTDYRTAGSVAA